MYISPLRKDVTKSLSEELQPWVGPNARTLGEVLFLRGRLRIEATIAGSLPYRVTLARTRDSIGASCTCPAMADSKRGCRHVWAVVLALLEFRRVDPWRLEAARFAPALRLIELLGKAVDVGLGRMKIIILEALLRLRQAALHPGLIDEKRRGEPSAKLGAFLPSIAEVIEEGHKALVFSQFTRFLAIVRERLDRMGVRDEYLDGKTKDRQGRVDAFQSDPDLPLFLVSLKAGGLGLNLTAADYVFLLDPWWNPAVESQAIDRAHRIGQTRNVSAIISADNSLIRNLTREDLSLLLS
jgi:hypothetical protein